MYVRMHLLDHHTLTKHLLPKDLMLLLLLCFARFIACLILYMVSKTLFVCFDDALWDDVLSNSPHSLAYPVASRFEIVAGILCLLTNGSAYPLPLCSLV